MQYSSETALGRAVKVVAVPKANQPYTIPSRLFEINIANQKDYISYYGIICEHQFCTHHFVNYTAVDVSLGHMFLS